MTLARDSRPKRGKVGLYELPFPIAVVSGDARKRHSWELGRGSNWELGVDMWELALPVGLGVNINTCTTPPFLRLSKAGACCT